MKIAIVAVGRLKQGAERDLVQRYRERAEALGRGLGVSGLDIAEIAESRARRDADRCRDEAEAIRRAAGPRFIAFDERGQAPSSEAFAAGLRRHLDQGLPGMAYVIGGPDGLDPALRAEAEAVLSFGALTIPHQLVRVLVAEQIYRAFTILAGHPYHRAGTER